MAEKPGGMSVAKITVTLPEAGRRLDVLLAQLLRDRGLSRSAIQRLMSEGRVLLDGRAAKASSDAAEGQVATVDAPDPNPEEAIAPLDLPLAVLYEDEACLAVDKPSGLVTHPAKGHWDDTLVNALAAAGVSLSSGTGPGRPGLLHRLDKETSGVLLLAKTDAAQAALAEQFKERLVRKRYLALVWGALPQDALEVDAPIGRDPRNRKKMAVREGGKSSKTGFRTVELLPHVSLVEARPLTGRTHQVRVHLAHLRHPVVGDSVYGGRPENGLPSALLRKKVAEAGRFFLHAHALSFESPSRGAVTVVSPLPPTFEELMEAFRKHG
jgi:23S rRNA pseudouridine1911/1915/1917 synthase